MKLPAKGLYLITDCRAPEYMFKQTEAALLAGAGILQYRNQVAAGITRLNQARQLADLCKQYQVPFIVNNDLELALRVVADGVHLGRHDPTLAVARARLGQNAIIGISCYNDFNRAKQAQEDGADYLALGAFFPSPSKPEAVRAAPELISQVKQLALPIAAIGGITPSNGGPLIEAGADYLAVISGIYSSANVYQSVKQYLALF